MSFLLFESDFEYYVVCIVFADFCLRYVFFCYFKLKLTHGCGYIIISKHETRFSLKLLANIFAVEYESYVH